MELERAVRLAARLLIALAAVRGVTKAIKTAVYVLRWLVGATSREDAAKETAKRFLNGNGLLKDLSTENMQATTLAHAGCEPCAATGALSPPIQLASTYERAQNLSYPRGFSYSREKNPTRSRLEDALATADAGVDAAAFASGSAAANAVFQTLVGGHVVMPDDVYYGNRQLLHTVFGPWGLGTTTIDASNLDEVRKAVKEAAAKVRDAQGRVLLWLETPSNPNLKITDIRRACEIAHEYGAAVLVDATWFSPAVCRPIELGCDLVLHSVTKYIGGHSDLIGGAVVAGSTPLATELFARIRSIQHYGGAVLAPFDCWLALRGMRSLAVRMAMHSRNGLAVAQFLDSHSAVTRVFYPGLESHPGHEIAKSQVKDNFGGMLSFLVATEQDAIKLTATMQLAKRGTSLGGTETLVEHRSSVEGPDSQTPKTLIRVSVGLEAAEDIISDFAQALDSISR
ncbi:Cystathionine gamma-lyase [Hondaea fermentalgiana]|uniref:cystathionine gamma-lyase n=1 Tax=Hondaea fermentalgiana TaxID=2315210 RepID=A0A2R5GJ99_9STRA|nr:Cystathionine gamma-lyase [Hondaea fermentalgiana]|eukprot:GBG27934.1 Cystathionine gamma-lyase [Hondaea fermentalgiana]